MKSVGDDRRRIVLEVMKLLPELGRAISRSMPAQARMEGVSVAQVKAMVHLFEYGPETMGELADGLGITTPSATGLINPLAELGFVERERDEEDRRVVRVRLSEHAQRLSHEILDQRIAEVASALEGMNLDAQECFLEGLRRLAAAYGKSGPALVEVGSNN
jgi:DNA-binding MarR family transcriptional regulator